MHEDLQTDGVAGSAATVRDRRSTPRGRDRRSTPRLQPVEYRAWLGWWDDADFLSFPVRLLDIGRGGVAAVLDASPPEGRPVWLRLEAGSMPTEGIRATAVGVTQIGPWSFVSRLSFDGPCPPGLWQAATAGYRSLEAVLNPGPRRRG
jgi:hypothetical protein